MPRPLDHRRRVELLAGVVEYIATNGLVDLSLRPLAAALGTSSRMLIYYFDTKEELLVQALATQRPDISTLFADLTRPREVRQRLAEFTDSSLGGDGATSVRVLLQVLGAACAPGSPYLRYADDAISAFVASLAAALGRVGTVDDPEAVATLLISGLRGVIQDRLITGEVERTGRAARRLIAQNIPDPS